MKLPENMYPPKPSKQPEAPTARDSVQEPVRGMRIDCSMQSNGSHAAAIVGVIIMFAIVAFGVWLSVTGNEFWGGAVMATLMLKFEPWIVRPLARLFSANVKLTDGVEGGAK
jgi:hypothetical protein